MRRLLITISALVLILASCVEIEPSRAAQDEQIQENIVESVRASNPMYIPQFSQTYNAVNKWNRRWDSPSKVSYVYILADTGQILGYYVSQGRPVSTCTFLTPPYQIIEQISVQDLVVPAPAMDGVYYGGCNGSSTFFFTADTDAYIEIGGLNYFVTDQPLAIDAQEFTISVEPE